MPVKLFRFYDLAELQEEMNKWEEACSDKVTVLNISFSTAFEASPKKFASDYVGELAYLALIWYKMKEETPSG